jgi:hypothetical protein
MILVPGIVITCTVVVSKLNRLAKARKRELESLPIDFGCDLLKPSEEWLGRRRAFNPGDIALPCVPARNICLTAIALDGRFTALESYAQFDDPIAFSWRKIIGYARKGGEILVEHRLKIAHWSIAGQFQPLCLNANTATSISANCNGTSARPVKPFHPMPRNPALPAVYFVSTSIRSSSMRIR